MPTPVHALPDGYREVRHLIATEPRTLLWLNLASLIPLVLMLLAMGSWASWIQQMRGPYNTLFSETLSPLVAVPLVLVITFGGHELIHGVAILWAGHRPRFGMALDKGVMYATADNALFPRNHFILIALAPLVILTLIGMAVMVIVPDAVGYYVGLIVVLNAAGAIGDLWMTAVVLGYPPSALVRDEADSIRIYLQAQS
jgi:hypothetical protein